MNEPTIGRAARNSVMLLWRWYYDSIGAKAIDETARRRKSKWPIMKSMVLFPKPSRRKLHWFRHKTVAKEEDVSFDINSLTKQERKELVKKLEKQIQLSKCLISSWQRQIHMMLEVKALD